MRIPPSMSLAMCIALLMVLAACQRQSAPATPAVTPSGSAPGAAVPVPVVLEDVIEQDPRYIIGISYPKIANKHPGLAAELKRYADAARAELLQAVAGLGEDKPSAPYDLSLAFSELAVTPQLIAVAADGSSYTGGAHGTPLVARFVWLPQQNKRLIATELVPDVRAWRDVSAHVREQLHAALSQRVDADDLAPAERAEIVRTAGRMIDEGTGADPANFEQFEPVMGPDGKLVAL
ncbi:MAG: DUF4163 domain-containing protein, partial [Gammaproteobacteria bacterium]|nr:DUF4163 domain-containing protein [Gammaproteobacteria bacterium]